MDRTLELPRSVLLALWLSVPDTDRAALLRAVQADDEPHTVDGGEDDEPGPLTRLLDACGDLPRDVAAAVPATGDPAAVPAAVSRAALDAGECVLVRTPAVCLAAIPAVERFGSSYEPGHLVTWRLHEVDDWRTGVLGTTGSLADAERELRQGLIDATEALVRLDVARWRLEAAEQIAGLRDAQVPGWRLPEGLDGRRVRVLASAARLRDIVALAARDDGGAVNLWQADQRSTALREVDRVARRAMGAAATSIAP
ncbi:hypothetical protein Cch01nite_16850 [Cellulomonas chitinilytica]|uniref:Uncharacterized protein n=1 Tax=Cellulomonas chitinilytica TaxID=398759 RepID=A0A919U115_9CELL|nr:hypothetical protein [Cellulomonas chitinilytica]GIG20961.1 hypothetical protein Cch01nite_16850 [Cellulomonas chitinilytica]